MTGLSNGELEARMRPGAWSQSGFLGPKETLIEVLDADARTMADIGVSAATLAARLDELITTVKAVPTRTALIDGRFDVRIEVFRGFQLCPWTPDPQHGQCTAGTGVRHASSRWWIRNRIRRADLRGPGLIAHLIDAHGFFEGRQVEGRVEPIELARLLELAPPAR
jgi:hypothetical protein